MPRIVEWVRQVALLNPHAELVLLQRLAQVRDEALTLRLVRREGCSGTENKTPC